MNDTIRYAVIGTAVPMLTGWAAFAAIMVSGPFGPGRFIAALAVWAAVSFPLQYVILRRL